MSTGPNAWGKFRAITAPVDKIRANQHFRPICVLAYRSRAVLRPFLLPPACWVPVVDVVAYSGLSPCFYVRSFRTKPGVPPVVVEADGFIDQHGVDNSVAQMLRSDTDDVIPFPSRLANPGLAAGEGTKTVEWIGGKPCIIGYYVRVKRHSIADLTSSHGEEISIGCTAVLRYPFPQRRCPLCLVRA